MHSNGLISFTFDRDYTYIVRLLTKYVTMMLVAFFFNITLISSVSCLNTLGKSLYRSPLYRQSISYLFNVNNGTQTRPSSTWVSCTVWLRWASRRLEEVRGSRWSRMSPSPTILSAKEGQAADNIPTRFTTSRSKRLYVYWNNWWGRKETNLSDCKIPGTHEAKGDRE